ncbi:hypothetical protein ANCDUO_00917 [Ancylostoma duodenale]|uniref:Uncharacterized protein n=1 Tax=Ancylostoma duodenale TaxID=51022 RepID=A0A0C2E082_9BILA|nr:hypothetical protein ANCDUO_00917 [Ancylostoma duodenale]
MAVGVDMDASIFHFAGAYDKVEAVIDQTDDFGKAVAENLKRSAARKVSEAKKRKRAEPQPFRKGGFSEGTGGSTFRFQTLPQLNFTQFDAHQFAIPQFLPAPSLNRGPFYSAPIAKTFSRAPNFPQRACFNYNQSKPATQIHTRNNRASAEREKDFVDEEIITLLHTGAITEFESKPTVVSPLSVAVATFDFKSAHHHVSIHPDDQKSIGWRRLGIDMSLCLDDGLVCGKSELDVFQALRTIRGDPEKVRVTLVLEKCVIEPTPVGHEAMIHLRAMNDRVIHSLVPLDWRGQKDEDEQHEIDYWIHRLKEDIDYELPSILISTDASALVLGAVIMSGNFEQTTAANVPVKMQGQSSKFREMLAVNIRVVVKWIPREMNWEADIASRRIDLDDWGINHAIAEAIQKRWGTACSDIFATFSNKKCKGFIGREWSGDESQVARDALTAENMDERAAMGCTPTEPNPLGHAEVGTCWRKSHNRHAILGSQSSFSAPKQLGGEWIDQVRDAVFLPTGPRPTKPQVERTYSCKERGGSTTLSPDPSPWKMAYICSQTKKEGSGRPTSNAPLAERRYNPCARSITARKRQQSKEEGDRGARYRQGST